MSLLARVLFSRTAAAAASALFFAIACGGTPSVSQKPSGVGNTGTGADGSGATGGTGADGSGATGGTSVVEVGGMAGETNGNGGVGNDPCAGPNPPPSCSDLMPSGPACGDGELNQDSEECDDGNSLPGDGCSGLCQVERYFECKTPGQPCESTIACGDGVLDPGEFCDDGNNDDDDGCSADCEVQDPSYVCPDAGKPCTLLYDCGDGRVNGSEECDDGNKSSNDGCSSKCKKETGYLCRRPGQACELDQGCGDGIVQDSLGEECDDGNSDFGDGCSSVCTIEPFYTCDTAGQPCVSTIVCGDGQRDPGEACDDGNTDDNDGCSSTCAQDSSYVCVTPMDGGAQVCTQKYKCGDGRLNGSDECDDGNNDDNDGCSADCHIESGYICHHPGQLCELNLFCGDGVVTASLGETCDDGNNNYDDGCYGDCTIAPYYTCPTPGAPCVSTIVCGDGKRDPGEACDDQNNTGGDGCAANCTVENNWKCSGPAGGKSACTKLVDCGDGKVSGGEQCDDGPTHKGSGDGCSSTCQLEPGFTCATPGQACTANVVCGDGKRAASEQCDDGGTTGGDGCSGQCKIEKDWTCSGGVGAKSTCSYTVVCGDGKLGGNEVCDDGNTASNDGCKGDCMAVETGYKCARAGVKCNPICGDGVKIAPEQCDIVQLGASATDLAACVKCQVTPGYTCTGGATGGLTPCKKTVCGNATPPTATPGTAAYLTAIKAAAETGEGCDDGNLIAGDGCGPTCQLEPPVTVGKDPSISDTCGDGLVTGTEKCDDGNQTAGDGCDAGCGIENGWSCSGVAKYPDSIKFKITYRDFRQRSENGGHPHMKVSGVTPPNSGNDPGIVGALCTLASPDVCGRLDTEGKPSYAGGTHATIDYTGDNLSATYHTNAFKLWYRDTNTDAVNDALTEADGSGSTNTPIVVWANPGLATGTDTTVHLYDTLTLTKTANLGNDTLSASYRYDSTNLTTMNANTFYPLGSASTVTGDGYTERGFGYTPGFSGTSRRNWHFTSELRYFFQYQGGETLTFFGDDDVFVFINGRLAVDIGGIHNQRSGRVVLGDDGAGTAGNANTCSVNISDDVSAPVGACALDANESAVADLSDLRYGLTKGKLYEIVVFQAERHPTGSDYQLTLDGFIPKRSYCSPVCGTNPAGQTPTVTLTPPEECDDGAANTVSPTYGKCTAGSCTLGPYCGDHIPNGTEQCDDAINNAQYGQSGCAPGCVNPAKCGDGNIDTPFEECDNGSGNSATGYGGCKTDCTIGPRCGDGQVNGGTEVCDDGVNDGSYGGCTPTCGNAPKCGDGTIDTQFGEECDGGASCDANCQLKCGNGVLDTGEQCDDGVLAGGYGRCAAGCIIAEYCGDGVRNGPEQCDLAPNNDGSYGGCTVDCKLGPFCGDDIVNGSETCDDGLNDGFYEGCNADCTPGPSCGDGVLSPEFGEECDDALTPTTCSACKLLGSCGDNIIQDPEECDDGADNVSTPVYGQCLAGSCTHQYCGDNLVNGPEECDNGSKNNDTKYEGCTTKCKLGPYCGDGDVDTAAGEKCDDGINDEFYGSCTPDCKGFGPYCGDNIVQPEWGEECDSKNDANCKNCRLGAQCGDGVVEKSLGEECDDGINDGGYGECGPKCTYGPRCGDGVVQTSAGEQCDDGADGNTGAYGKCAPGCVYGPYCGDGKIQKPYEECDDKNNKNGDGCSSACKKETQVPR